MPIHPSQRKFIFVVPPENRAAQYPAMQPAREEQARLDDAGAAASSSYYNLASRDRHLQRVFSGSISAGASSRSRQDLESYLHTLHLWVDHGLAIERPARAEVRARIMHWQDAGRVEVPLDLSAASLRKAGMTNPLSEMPPLPPGLRAVDVSGHTLKRLPAKHLPNTLVSLKAAECGLLFLPELPPHLRKLNVAGNSLINLPNRLPASLTHLDASCGAAELEVPEGILEAASREIVPCRIDLRGTRLSAASQQRIAAHNYRHTLHLWVDHGLAIERPTRAEVRARIMHWQEAGRAEAPLDLSAASLRKAGMTNPLSEMPPLPPGLRAVDVSGHILKRLPAKHLPNTLVSLKAAECGLLFLPELPPHLRELNVAGNPLINLLNSLPASLTHLDASCGAAELEVPEGILEAASRDIVPCRIDLRGTRLTAASQQGIAAHNERVVRNRVGVSIITGELPGQPLRARRINADDISSSNQDRESYCHSFEPGTGTDRTHNSASTAASVTGASPVFTSSPLRQQDDEENVRPTDDEDRAWRKEHDNSLEAEAQSQAPAMSASSSKAVASTQLRVYSRRKRPAGNPPKEAEPKRQKEIDAVVVKQEPVSLGSVFSAPVEGMESSRINTAQMRHVPTTSYVLVDLNAEDGSAMQQAFTVRHTNETIISSGNQTYDPVMDKLFPIRDPAHPERIHPDYADPDDPNRCSPNVKIKGIHFYKSNSSVINEEALWRFMKNFEDHPFKKKAEFIEAITASCLAELEAMRQGQEPPSSRYVKIEEITQESQCDSQEEFKALKNQYGGFLKDYAPSKQPSLGNGKIVCLLAGAKLASIEEDQQYMTSFGTEFRSRILRDYGANVKKYGKREQVAWMPYGGGNMGQYFNSSFKPDAKGKLVVDTEQVNAFFCPVMLDLTDRNGIARKESMLAVVQHRPIVEGKQIKIDYGNKYTLDTGTSQSMKTQPVPLAIKQEVDAWN